MKISRKQFYIFLIGAGLMVLPACEFPDWLKSKTMGMGDRNMSQGVVASIGGKPAINEAEYEKFLHLVMQAQPAFEQMFAFMSPDQQQQFLHNMAEDLALGKLAMEWATRTGLAQTEEFKNELKQICEFTQRDFVIRKFESEMIKQLVFSDEDAQQFYNANREKHPAFQRPPFTTGTGVKAEGFIATNEKEAQDLAEKARKNNFTTTAKNAKKSVISFGVITAQSSVDPLIRAKVLSIKKFPSIEIIKGADNKYYVVKASGQETGTFAPFEAIKDKVKEVMKSSEKMQEYIMNKINQLKADYNFIVHKEAFEKYIRKPEPMEPIAQEQKQAPAMAKAA